MTARVTEFWFKLPTTANTCNLLSSIPNNAYPSQPTSSQKGSLHSADPAPIIHGARVARNVPLKIRGGVGVGKPIPPEILVHVPFISSPATCPLNENW